MQKYTGSVFRKFDSNATGNIAVGAIVTVRKAMDNALATLYGVDNTSSSPLPNPLTTDVNGQYSFYAPNGKYNITFSNAATPALLGVQLLDLDEIAAKYVTLEDFNADAGNGDDDTSAWVAACAESIATGKTILLLNKTYLITPQDGTTVYQLSSLEGIGEATIKSFTSVTDAGISFLCDMTFPLGGHIKNVRFDGNLSADHETWTSGNYNTWTGARGVRILNSVGVILENVVGTNFYNPAFQDVACENIVYENCRTDRTRGVFGDGFNSAESKRVTYNNCYAKDFTRIGFVADKTTGDACEHITYNNCIAEDGHDAAVLHGGNEYNSGFWHEFAVNITYNNCGAINAGGTGGQGRGFTCAMVFNSPIIEDLPEVYGTTYNGCWVKAPAGGNTQDNGFTIGSLGNTRGVITLTNCHVENCLVSYFISNDRNLVLLENCTSVSSLEMTSPTGAKQSLLISGGEVTIEGFREYINLPTGSWTPLDSDVAAATIGSYDVDRPVKLTVKNLRSYQYDTKVAIPSRIQHEFSAQRTVIYVEDATLDQANLWCKELHYNNCTLTKTGQESVTDLFLITNCNITGTGGVGGDPALFAWSIVPTNGLHVRGCTFNFTNNNYLYFNNEGLNNLGRVSVSNCTFKKNMELHGSMIRLNELVAAFDTSDLQWLDISNCRFINTGSTTANPIVFSDQRNTGGNGAVVRVFGDSNFKSPTITNNATAGVTTSQWTVTALT